MDASEESNVSRNGKSSAPAGPVVMTALATISLLFLDIVFYGELFPLLGLYIGNAIAARFRFPLSVELFLVIGSSFVIFFIALAFRIEKNFWKKLYALESSYTAILYLRDTLNLVILGCHVASLVTTVITATKVPETRSRALVLHHPITAFWEVACSRAARYGMRKSFHRCVDLPASATAYEASFEEGVLHAASFLTVAVSKMLYFNTLFTYLQTLKMFREIQENAERRRQQDGGGGVRRRRHRTPLPDPQPAPAVSDSENANTEPSQPSDEN